MFWRRVCKDVLNPRTGFVGWFWWMRRWTGVWKLDFSGNERQTVTPPPTPHGHDVSCYATIWMHHWLLLRTFYCHVSEIKRGQFEYRYYRHMVWDLWSENFVYKGILPTHSDADNSSHVPSRLFVYFGQLVNSSIIFINTAVNWFMFVLSLKQITSRG